MISHKLQFIFIHIPKTSGNSLSLFLQDFTDNKVIQKESKLGKKQGISILCEYQTNFRNFTTLKNNLDELLLILTGKIGIDLSV